ncbi:MAG TPA: hypothetical protein VFX44_07110 [Solirubrobacterales bacterium]|nr:hypothetical protein [Solirubrobacterales bacterium]
MNEGEAKELCAQLTAEHPDRFTHRWTALEGKDGNWSVVKVGLPPATEPTGTQLRATPEPPADDPRIHPPWLNPPSGGIV